MSLYDVTIIGSGPGGYSSAIRCAQLGLKTAIVEKEVTKGGTCLNVGCIPTKTLIEMTALLQDVDKHSKKYGINFGDVSVDLEVMMKRKNSVIQQNAKGIDVLLQKNGVDVFSGTAAFSSTNEIIIQSETSKSQTVSSKKFIIATGSKPSDLPFAKFDHERIMSSTDMLSLHSIPSSLLIIGAGVIGLEIGMIYKRLGTQVEILEIADSVLPNFDESLRKEIARSMKKLGIRFKFGVQVQQVTKQSENVIVEAKDSKGDSIRVEADYCMLATGRKPSSNELNLEKLGVALNKNGSIKISQDYQTNVENIYAIGDVVGGVMLAHKAAEEGVLLAEKLVGKTRDLNYKAIPSVVYTSPECASVGFTEEELKAEGRSYRTGICQNRALGRAHTSDKLDGFAKVLIDDEKETILGIHLVAPHASEMIGEAVLAFEEGLTATQLANMSHAHPTFQEAIKEACLIAAEGRSIHVL